MKDGKVIAASAEENWRAKAADRISAHPDTKSVEEKKPPLGREFAMGVTRSIERWSERGRVRIGLHGIGATGEAPAIVAGFLS
jgi:hypothetical protein